MPDDSDPEEIPAGLVDWLIEREGDAARSWVTSLPRLIDRMCDRWGLTVAGPPIGGGTFAIVIPVLRGGDRAALKCVWPGTPIHEEVAGLRAWDGRGVVRLLASDPQAHALLLEWLDPERSLSSVPPVAERVEQAIAAMPVRWNGLGGPFPRALLSRAIDMAPRHGPCSAPLLVNWDLHHGNILAGAREPWLVIDPVIGAGDPEVAIWPMVLRLVDELPNPNALRAFFGRVVEAGGLDPDLARAWALFRAIDYWLWALDYGLTEDPVRCARIIDWLGL